MLGDILVDRDLLKSDEKETNRRLLFGGDADHHFHPGNGTDKWLDVALYFSAGRFETIEIVDQDIGIEQGFHDSHSSRSLC